MKYLALSEACHLLFIQCEECAKAMDHCCSHACKEVHGPYPFETQKALRKEKRLVILTFKKGRSEVLKYKK